MIIVAFVLLHCVSKKAMTFLFLITQSKITDFNNFFGMQNVEKN